MGEREVLCMCSTVGWEMEAGCRQTSPSPRAEDLEFL